MVEPFGDAASARTELFARGFQLSSAPVLRLNAASRARATSRVPAATPAGRTAVKLPPRYTVSPTTSRADTRPLVWNVASTVCRRVEVAAAAPWTGPSPTRHAATTNKQASSPARRRKRIGGVFRAAREWQYPQF